MSRDSPSQLFDLRKVSPEFSKNRKIVDFLCFLFEKSCDFRAVRLPAGGALSHYQTHPSVQSNQHLEARRWIKEQQQ